MLGNVSWCDVSFILAHSLYAYPTFVYVLNAFCMHFHWAGSSRDFWDELEIGNKTIGVLGPNLLKFLSAEGQERRAIKLFLKKKTQIADSGEILSLAFLTCCHLGL